jgi:serine/threonine protein kinase
MVLLDFTHALCKNIKNIYLDKEVSTYTYRAPEVCNYRSIGNLKRYNAYDEKIDIWSLGVVLYELCTTDTILDMAKRYNTIKKLTESTNDEDIIEAFVQCKDFEQILKKDIKIKSCYKFSHEYHTWIIKLLSQDSKKRPYASTFLNDIISFVAENNIKIHTIKYNNVVECFKIKYHNKYNLNLYTKCIKLIDIINITIPKKSIYKIVKYLLGIKIISNDSPKCNLLININNYRYMITALMILISTVIYDDIIEIDKCNNLGHYKYDINLLHNCIYELSNYFSAILLNFKQFIY